MAKVRRKRKRKAKIAPLLTALFVCVILLAAIIAAAFVYHRQRVEHYRTHFFEGTEINGVDVSGQTVEEVKRSITNKIETYNLTVREKEGEEILTSADVGWTYADDAAVEALLAKQDAEHWYQTISEIYTYQVDEKSTYDKDKALAAVEKMACFKEENVTAPKDAELKSDGNGYYIEKEVVGNKLDAAKVKEAVIKALDEHAAEVSLTEPDCYIYPQVTSDDENLIKRMTLLNRYLDLKINYVFGQNVETIDREILMPHVKDDGKDVTLDTDFVRDLVYAWGQKYDTFGLARKFTTHDGREIDIPAGGDYGWVIDKDKTIEAVKAAIVNFDEGNHEVIFKYKAMGWDNGDITGTYAEVDIKKQMLYVYKDGKIAVETKVVTGKPTKDRKTQIGIWAIDAKKEKAVLGRMDVQGYAEPVDFWLPFNGGQGLHDAPWRSEFGGEIYKTNGSHGCVNVPVDQMEKVFAILEIGHAVIVYDS